MLDKNTVFVSMLALASPLSFILIYPILIVLDESVFLLPLILPIFLSINIIC